VNLARPPRHTADGLAPPGVSPLPRLPATIARALATALAAALALGLIAAACQPGASPSTSLPGTSAQPTSQPTALGPPVTLAPGQTPLVPIDPSLLKALPDEVDNLSVLESSEAEADAETNQSLASLADSAAGALAIDPTTSDYVLALVVHLRPNALTDDGFQSWRAAYDQGVCADSGIIATAESEIGGRTVFVGTCGNGFHTYHAWIQASQLLISASSGGTRRLGELLFQNLRP